MKNLTLLACLFVSVLFNQAHAQSDLGNISTSTNFEMAGTTIQVTLSTSPQYIPGKLNYTFQIYFGDGAYAAASVPLYSNDTSFTTTHTYATDGIYTITYILGYADMENAGPAGLELAQTSQTINVGDVATGLTTLSPDPKTDIFYSNKLLTVKSELNVTEVQIFNVAGQQIENLNPGTSGTINIPLSTTFVPGLYIVAVKNSDNKTLTKKIFVD